MNEHTSEALDLHIRSIHRNIRDVCKHIDNIHTPSKTTLVGLISTLANFGYTEAHLPLEKNGLGLPCKVQWEIIRTLSYYNPGIALSYLAHTILTYQSLAQHGSSDLQNIVSTLQLGKKLGCCAMSEPEAGSDLMSMQTYAKECSNQYTIFGEKCWITNAPYADYALVYAKVDHKQSRNIGLFLVPCDNENLTQSTPIEKIGMKSSPTGSIHFDGVIIPKNYRIDSDNAKKLLFEQLHFERLMLSAGPIGIMDYAYEKAISYTKIRKQFGQPINQLGQIQLILANMWTQHQASIALCEKALQRTQGTFIRPEWGSSCYLMAAETAMKVVEDAIQCHGANGYVTENKLGQYWHDAKLYTIGGGTSEIRRSVISKSISQ